MDATGTMKALESRQRADDRAGQRGTSRFQSLNCASVSGGPQS